MSRIKQAFEKQQALLIPYITAGDPDLETTFQSVQTLARSGADMIELGIPFTEPIADGPTIQKSSERALKNPFAMQDIFDLVKRLRDSGVGIPIVLMSYANPVYVYGLEAFCKQAVAHGVDGLLLTDMPPEEANDYLKFAKNAGLETIFLCSPTTSQKRLTLIDQSSSAFVYYVARAGVTGVRKDLPEDVQTKLASLRDGISNKLCVGFGISTAEQAKTLSPHTDGIIIGSAIVSLFEEHSGDALQQQLAQFLQGIKTSQGLAA